jgi:tetratricopeptide (TPR) repeat protein
MVDDIQWADDAGAQVLHYLARQAVARPVLVILAFRDEAIDADRQLARLVQSLHRETEARRMVLGRLGREETGELVSALADSAFDAPGLAGRLHRETDGNPFFLISILQSLNAGETRLQPDPASATGLLPDALRAAVRVRLAHVPGELRPVLESAAVLGRRFDFDTLLGLLRGPEEPLLEAVEALVRRRLLREEPDDGVYDFSHDKVREVVYRDISGARRRLLHQAVAEALERQDEGSTHERCLQLAEHFERAQVWSKALRYLLLAGERSLALFAMRDALHWFDRAVALAESHPEAADQAARLQIYARRGSARAQAGQTQGAVSDFRRVLDAARAGGDRARARDALVQLGMAYRRADNYGEATACLTEALAQSRAMGDDPHAADTLYHLGTVAWSNGLNLQAIAFHQEAVALCQRAGWSDLVAVQAYHGLGESHYANAEPLAAIDCFTRSLELARQRGDKGYESENLMMIGHACVGTKGLGDYPRAEMNLNAALKIAQDADLQWHLGPTLLGLDHVRACTGRYGEAWQGMRQTLQWLESLQQTRYQLIAHDYLGLLLLDLGRPDLAMETLERALAIGRDTRIMFWRGAIEANLAVARSQIGHAGVLSDLRQTLERTRSTSERCMMVRCLDALAQIALADGDSRRCCSHAEELLAIAEANGLAELQASARRWRGEAWLLEGALLPAHEELSVAADRADRIGRVRLQIDLQLALGRACAALGRDEAAQQHRAGARDLIRIVERGVAQAGLQAQLPMMAAPH